MIDIDIDGVEEELLLDDDELDDGFEEEYVGREVVVLNQVKSYLRNN